MPILRLENEVQRYAWGSPTVIPELLGVENPSGEPWAELWMGAHPKAPSRVLLESGALPLDRFIADRPREILGARVAERFGNKLPFLFKVLAASEPLSIQCHPTRVQAEEGFRRENEAGIPLDATHRNFRDDNHKPELIVALSPFFALKGFRSHDAIARSLREVGAESLEPEIRALEKAPGKASLRRLFTTVMTLEGERRRCVLEEIARGTADERSLEARCVQRLLARYPNDVGVLSPLLLEHIELLPGEGLFLPAGELHAYLEGVGLELMANSDNVLRGGLTPKHVDVPELLRVVRFEPSPPGVLRPSVDSSGLRAYETPAAEFCLLSAEVRPGAPLERGARDALEILLTVEGELVLVDEDTGARLPFPKGGSALVPADVGAWRAEGEGRLWIATVPD